jgi:hypothetical protein
MKKCTSRPDVETPTELPNLDFCIREELSRRVESVPSIVTTATYWISFADGVKRMARDRLLPLEYDVDAADIVKRLTVLAIKGSLRPTA